MRPDRVVIGLESERACEVMKKLYAPFMLSRERLYVMDIASAELTKYAANTALACRISFMNWLSSLAEKTGADITEVRKGIGSDERIGFSFLWAGCGFGGSCFPKDIKALRATCEANSLDTSLPDSILAINERQKRVLFDKIEEYFSHRDGLFGKTIGILGLSFKPDTDDMRQAPSLVLIDLLLKAGAKVQLYDPVATTNAKALLGDNDAICWCSSEKEAATSADALALVTEWKQFRHLEMKDLLLVMKGNGFFDGRNQYEPEEMARLGFNYFSIGRPAAFSALFREFEKVAADAPAYL
jgi:UDPglucose 6-dehydrogenase